MDGTGAMPLYGLQMTLGPITFVLMKSIRWKPFMIGSHDPVSIHLGNNRGGGDAQASLIPFFQASLRDIDGDRMNPVHKQILRGRAQR